MDDITSSGDDHYYSNKYKGRVPTGNRVANLTTTLKDTNRNLRSVDQMLENYKDLGEQQASAMDKLREDLLKTSERLKEEKLRKSQKEFRKPPVGLYRRSTESLNSRRRCPTSPLKDYDFDHATSDYDERDMCSPGRKRNAGPRDRVRFYDDMDADESIHELHQSIRDLGSGQLRIEDDLNREITRRNRYEHETARAMKHVAENVHKSSVDARLDTIQSELQKEREVLRKNQDNVGQLSSQLKQNEDLRKQLLRSEEEKYRLKEKMERQEDFLKQQQLEGRDRDYYERERRRLEEEVENLRSKLTRSASALGDLGGVHRELEKSERQRQQLSDHIQVLQKELDNGDKQSAKVLRALQDMTESYNTAENERQSLEYQVRQLTKDLKETSVKSDGLSDELKDSQLLLHSSQHKREEMKIRAQETVKQWKAKCKRQEKELGILQMNSQKLSSRCEQLSKELDGSRVQVAHSSQQVEVLRRELNQLVGIRAQQEEDVRIKDIQVNELKSFRADLERDLRDCKTVIERMEHELHSEKDKATAILEEKMKVEEQFNGMQQNQLAAETQLRHFQKEVKELNLLRINLAGQLAESSNEKLDLKTKLKEARRNEANAREEMEALVKRFKENSEANTVENINRQRKKDLADYHADIEALRLEAETEKSNVKVLKKQNNKLKSEVDRVNIELANKDEELAEAERKYHLVREEFISRSQVTEDDLSRAKELELELMDVKEAAQRLEKDNTNILHTIAAELDGVIEVAAMDSIETYKALNLGKNPSEPSGILAEVQSKLHWLKNELRELRHKENRMKNDIKEAVIGNDKDRNLLLAEIERQSDALEQLAFHRQSVDIPERDLHDASQVQLLVGDYAPTTDTYNNTQYTNTNGNVSMTQSDFTINDSILMKTQEEREKIHERYSKLQDTMNALRQELFAQKHYADVMQDELMSTATTQSRRVRISSPHTSPYRNQHSRERRSRSSSPARRSSSRSPSSSSRRQQHSRSRSPGSRLSTNNLLTLTDEEFNNMFVPKSPSGLLTREADMY